MDGRTGPASIAAGQVGAWPWQLARHEGGELRNQWECLAGRRPVRAGPLRERERERASRHDAACMHDSLQCSIGWCRTGRRGLTRGIIPARGCGDNIARSVASQSKHMLVAVRPAGDQSGSPSVVCMQVPACRGWRGKLSLQATTGRPTCVRTRAPTAAAAATRSRPRAVSSAAWQR